MEPLEKTGNKALDDAAATLKANFGKVLWVHGRMIYTLSTRLCGNAGGGQLLAEETFVKAHANHTQFREENSMSSWLYRICVDLWKDKLRGVKSRFAGLGTKATQADPFAEAAPSEQDVDIHGLEEHGAIHRALFSLTPLERALVIMRDMDGKPFEEICEMLQVPIDRAEASIAQASENLRRILQPLLGNDGDLSQELVRLRAKLHQQTTLDVPGAFYSTVISRIKNTGFSVALQYKSVFKTVIMVGLGIAAIWAIVSFLISLRVLVPSPAALPSFTGGGAPAPKVGDSNFRAVPVVTKKDGEEYKLGPLAAFFQRLVTSAPSQTQKSIPSQEQKSIPSQTTPPVVSTHPAVQGTVNEAAKNYAAASLSTAPTTALKSSTTIKGPAAKVPPAKSAKKKVAVRAKPAAAAQSKKSVLPVQEPALAVQNSTARAKPNTTLVERHSENEVAVPTELVEWKGQKSEGRKFRTYVITSQPQMSDIWKRLLPNMSVPEVDFEKYLVIGITSGQTHTSGISFEIMGTRAGIDTLIVYYREVRDISRTQTSVATFRPYHFKVILRTDLPIKFQQL